MIKASRFDAAEFLDDDETIAEYLKAALEDNDEEFFIVALGDAARAKGMTEIAKKAGIGRESLYKTLSGSVKPKFETVSKILKALDVEFKLAPIAKKSGKKAAKESDSAKPVKPAKKEAKPAELAA